MIEFRLVVDRVCKKICESFLSSEWKVFNGEDNEKKFKMIFFLIKFDIVRVVLRMLSVLYYGGSVRKF